MTRRISNIIINAFAFILLLSLAGACSDKDDDVRMPEDILGVWSPDDSLYLEFSTNNEVHKLSVFEQDGESIGQWDMEVYFYEPGYNLVIYINNENEATVYQIISMDNNEMTWCWVEDIPQEKVEEEGIGKILGEIINQAQEGFKLDPELYQSYKKIPENEFFDILEKLDIFYPW